MQVRAAELESFIKKRTEYLDKESHFLVFDKDVCFTENQKIVTCMINEIYQTGRDSLDQIDNFFFGDDTNVFIHGNNMNAVVPNAEYNQQN